MKEIVFMLRKKLVMAICMALFAALVPINLAAAEGFDYNPMDSGSRIGTALLTDYWMDNSKAAESLNEYLRAVTDETSPDYIPRENRIAVFDLDGTLMCETYPFCFEYMVFTDYALNHSEEMPEDVLAVAQEIVDATGGEKPSGMSTRQAAAAAIAYKGMTMAELAKVVEDFKSSDAWGFTGMTRGEAWYKPMVELFEKLQKNGFSVYVVTAAERNIVRQVIAGTLDIPPSHVIGTEYGYTATNQGDVADADYTFQSKDQIVFDGNYYGENATTSKVDAIVREIGQQPVLAFGNSSGDLAMEVYTITGNPFRSAAYMVLADDAKREYGSFDGTAAKKTSYEEMGIGVISMRDDFATIYGDNVEKKQTPEIIKVSYLGPAGTYTEEAAQFWFREGETLDPKKTVNDAVMDVLSGDADFAVIPQENTLGGAVVNYVDTLIAAEDACVVGEVVLPISQTLMGVSGATIEDVKTVCSHAQGLTQSAAWRSEYLPDAEAFVPVRATATRIDQFGDIVFDVKKTDLDQAGLEYGDSVDFRFSGGYEIKAVPYFSDFYGRKGTAILAFYMDEVVLGSVASNLNLVVGIEPGETAIMTLAQRGRYREEYKAYNINDARYRMEGQTDAAFINAREVTAGGIRPGRLYRGSTPFDPAFGRIELMGSYIEAHSIGGILNLANGQAEMKTGEGLPDYTSDMIEQGRVLTCHLGVDYTEPAAMRSIGEGLDRLMELEGPWLIHCSLGRDRTGVICAVVEALCGATYDEIVQDYMISYDLLHNIDMNPESLQYRLFKMRIDDILAAIFGTEIEALPGIDLRLAARDYLMRCGMTGDKIDKLERLLISD